MSKKKRGRLVASMYFGSGLSSSSSMTATTRGLKAYACDKLRMERWTVVQMVQIDEGGGCRKDRGMILDEDTRKYGAVCVCSDIQF